MKKLIFYIGLIIAFLSISTPAFSIGGGCSGPEMSPCDADPICNTSDFNFPNNASGCPPSGVNIGCLSVVHGATWLYFKVSESGTLQFQLSQANASGSGLDVDFSLYGPFTDLNSGCNSILNGQAPIQCSYHGSATETIGVGLSGGTNATPGGATTPPSAVIDEYYIILVSNYSEKDGFVSLDQTGGTGLIDCTIITPCDIDITAAPGTCDPTTNNYTLSGEVTFSDEPATGTLIIEDCNGNSTILTAPFTSPASYTISGIDSDGATCNVTAHFSDDPACTVTSTDYQSPPSCDCVQPNVVVDVLTICDGASVDLNNAINPASDPVTTSFYNAYTDADNATNPIGNTVSTAGTYWLRAEDPTDPSCYTLISVVVDVTTITYTPTITDATCMDANGIIEIVGAGGTAPYTYTINNGVTPSESNTTGVFNNQIQGSYNVTIEDQSGCILNEIILVNNIGAPFFGPVILTSPSCFGLCDGEVEVNVTDGVLPYTYVVTNMDGDVVGNQQDGGTTVMTGLCEGRYIIDVTDDTGCRALNDTIIPGVHAVNSDFTFADFCVEAANGPANIATPGGTFSFDPLVNDGATIDPSSGVISNPVIGGTYFVKYTTPGACPETSIQEVNVIGVSLTTTISHPNCGNSDGFIGIVFDEGTAPFDYTFGVGTNVQAGNTTQNTQNIVNLPANTYSLSIEDANGCVLDTVISLIDVPGPYIASFSDTTICLGDSITLSVDNPENAVITWNNGLNNGDIITPTVADTIIYTVTARNDAGCTSTDQTTVIVRPLPEPLFTANTVIGCAPMLIEFTDTTGMPVVNCFWDFGDGTTSNNCDTVSHTYQNTGTYDVTLTIEDTVGCVGILTKTDYVEVVVAPVADFTASPSITDMDDTNVEFTNQSTNATDYEWEFGDQSSNNNSVNPSHEFPNGAPGQYVVTLIATNDIGCSSSHQEIITIVAPDISFDIPNVFTPNGDNENDFFKLIKHKGISDLDVTILNRWGNLVFDSDDVDFKWNGQVHNTGNECVDGVYFYKITVNGINGETQEKSGFVHLVRGK